jgi:hypothetical protein
LTLLNDNIPSKRLKTVAIWLYNRNGNVPRFARVDVPHRSGFSFVRAGNNAAVVAVFQAWFSWLLHVIRSVP